MIVLSWFFRRILEKSKPVLQRGDLRKRDQRSILREGGAGEAFEALVGRRSGPQHNRDRIVALAIDRNRRTAEIGLQHLGDLFRRYSQLPDPILIDVDDDLENLVAPVIVIVANARRGLKQRSHLCAKRKKTIRVGPRDFDIDDAGFYRAHRQALDLEARFGMVFIKIFPCAVGGTNRALIVLGVDQEKSRRRIGRDRRQRQIKSRAAVADVENMAGDLRILFRIGKPFGNLQRAGLGFRYVRAIRHVHIDQELIAFAERKHLLGQPLNCMTASATSTKHAHTTMTGKRTAKRKMEA